MQREYANNGEEQHHLSGPSLRHSRSCCRGRQIIAEEPGFVRTIDEIQVQVAPKIRRLEAQVSSAVVEIERTCTVSAAACAGVAELQAPRRSAGRKHDQHLAETGSDISLGKGGGVDERVHHRECAQTIKCESAVSWIIRKSKRSDADRYLYARSCIVIEGEGEGDG